MDRPILIIEDVEETRLYLKHLLEQIGFTQVEMAEDGAQASELLDKNEFSLMLLDIELPDIDGKMLLDQYKIKYPDMAVIMCSSHNTVENVKYTWDMGANGFLAKPVDLNKIKNLLLRLNFPV